MSNKVALKLNQKRHGETHLNVVDADSKLHNHLVQSGVFDEHELLVENYKLYAIWLSSQIRMENPERMISDILPEVCYLILKNMVKTLDLPECLDSVSTLILLKCIDTININEDKVRSQIKGLTPNQVANIIIDINRCPTRYLPEVSLFDYLQFLQFVPTDMLFTYGLRTFMGQVVYDVRIQKEFNIKEGDFPSPGFNLVSEQFLSPAKYRKNSLDNRAAHIKSVNYQ